MNAPQPPLKALQLADAEAAIASLAEPLKAGKIVPYLGPGVAGLGQPSAPMTPEALAEFFGVKVALPRRAKGNAWAAAQHIENMKHRSTVTALMTEAFATPVEPTPLHRYFASLKLPMIVDTWYDGATRKALEEQSAGTWGEVQGITRAGIGEDRWYRFYEADGKESTRAAAEGWTTLLYKPHGSITPSKNYLISDADYVEVLTEIDIQTPIPDVVKDRRTERSFLFFGCRFHDQMLRTYARQVMKRSSAIHYVIVDPEKLTKNEIWFITVQGMTPIGISLARAAEILLKSA
ncbi:MAG TPA: SIR2 family protein [Methylocella sp.]|nr:SIR2 family protein [Methylocella sp.]